MLVIDTVKPAPADSLEHFARWKNNMQSKLLPQNSTSKKIKIKVVK